MTYPQPKRSGGLISKEPLRKEGRIQYFMAFRENTVNNYTTFPLYFVNDSDNLIELMFLIRPGIVDKFKGISSLAEIGDEFVDNEWLKKFTNVPPHSFLADTLFYDWDFDWSNSRDVLMRTRGEEHYLHFHFKKYFVFDQPMTDNLPVLHNPGWICM